MTFTHRISALLLTFSLLLPADLHASDLMLPREPSKADIPARNYLGERVRGLTFRATSVSRRSDGQMVVMYGFIVGRPSGRANFFYWNDLQGIECHGTTRKDDRGRGVGVNICRQNGRTILRDKVTIPSEKYMHFHGTTKQKNRDLQGRVVWTILRWHLRSGFPNPQPLIDAFGHE
ncbi:hypothetical protein O2N63_00160 [Aliiroseovarius sp. KMU-50]|uniref:Uncharacterized protein n=1 Tax=Aliiroseovarius salicola TaxID=3009082 RepID=A0ABT4VW80_9RHOB|nr:hypothetical protein [Aliiroseovarius sp. KMU-50]MDA5092501.1 hypothetical protein [Aliiroseovarius sp. KMU-50]